MNTFRTALVRANRLNRALLALGISVALWFLLGLITRLACDRLLPGIADDGAWPIAALPWMLARSNVPARPWNDGAHAAVWFLAIATLFVPVFSVFVATKLKSGRNMASCFTAVLVGWALYRTFWVQYSYVMLVDHWPGSVFSMVWFVVEPLLWVLAICGAAVYLGQAIRRLIWLRSV